MRRHEKPAAVPFGRVLRLAGIARCALLLDPYSFVHTRLDARQVWKEQPSVKPAFIFDDYAINFWIQIVETARLGRGKNIDRIFETRKFVSANGKKSWIARGGADRVHYDFFGKRVLDRLY